MNKLHFQIDPDIGKAETISSEFYKDEHYFELSKEKIFARTWQLVGSLDEIQNIKSHTILEGFMDEPILLTKAQDKTIKCLSNVCTHRGKILVEKDCKADGIRCSYHGRRFDLSGNFLSMPEFEGVENFPNERDNLTEIPCSIWENFIFLSLDPIAPFSEFIGEMKETLKSFDFENLKLVSTKDYEVKAHWALYCENYLEGFHIPFVHKSLNEELDYGNYKTETFRFSSLQTGFGDDKKIAAYYFFIFPNLMFNFYPWGISVNIVKPIKKDITKVSYLTFINDESRLNTGAGADLETVELEDQKVVESVQQGINSRFYEKGRYSPTREQGTHHFHRLIAEFMK
jgi:choline monooxygenase